MEVSMPIPLRAATLIRRHLRYVTDEEMLRRSPCRTRRGGGEGS